MTDEQHIWLKEHRCPWCKSRNCKQCAYKVVKAYDGWRCYGYRCDDERRVGE